MWLNQTKYQCFCTKQMSWRKHSKVPRAAPKKQFFGVLLLDLVGTVACLWHHGGFQVAVETPHRDCTGAGVAESVPRGIPKSLPAAGAWTLVASR